MCGFGITSFLSLFDNNIYICYYRLFPLLCDGTGFALSLNLNAENILRWHKKRFARKGRFSYETIGFFDSLFNGNARRYGQWRFHHDVSTDAG